MVPFLTRAYSSYPEQIPHNTHGNQNADHTNWFLKREYLQKGFYFTAIYGHRSDESVYLPYTNIGQFLPNPTAKEILP